MPCSLVRAHNCVRACLLEREQAARFRVCLFCGGCSLDGNQITDVGAVKIVEALPRTELTALV